MFTAQEKGIVRVQSHNLAEETWRTCGRQNTINETRVISCIFFFSLGNTKPRSLF